MNKKVTVVETSRASRFRLERETVRVLTSQELALAVAGECPTGSITSGVPPTGLLSPATCN
jgi:hypothetical protein